MATSSEVQRGKTTRTFGEVTISSEFDSGNIDRIEVIPDDSNREVEFALWTSPDCAGTPYENGNRSWFYFKVFTPANFDGKILRFNIMNLNRQTRLYNQGLTPFLKSFPGRSHWERLRGPVQYEMENGEMKLSFDYTVPDCQKRSTYFAFCYPFSYTDCQSKLEKLDSKYSCPEDSSMTDSDAIYYHRELLIRSLDQRRVDLVTVTSRHGMTEEEEPRIEGLFPDNITPRARKFKNKKVFVLSSRVHPGETPSSFVFNGFLNFILHPDDPRASTLRRHFVFKLIPMLNPDGVSRGHYRMDSRGANLNRHYLSPQRELHPSIYAARCLFLHHHNKRTHRNSVENPDSNGTGGNGANTDARLLNSHTDLTATVHSEENTQPHGASMEGVSSEDVCFNCKEETASSGVAFYVDLHGHASKRGCFIYGNHFKREADQTETMLFPKLISLNSAHFDFGACLFSEKNMYASDKNGTSKEGSGRVSLHKASGHLHCYTLECNYNSGRLVNAVPAASTDGGRATPPQEPSFMPHKYSIEDYEEVGRGMAVAVLDMFQMNPWSRVPRTDQGSLAGIRHALLHQVTTARCNKASNKHLPTGSKQTKNVSDTEDVPAPHSKSRQVLGPTITSRSSRKGVLPASLSKPVLSSHQGGTTGQDRGTACCISGGRHIPATVYKHTPTLDDRTHSSDDHAPSPEEHLRLKPSSGRSILSNISVSKSQVLGKKDAKRSSSKDSHPSYLSLAACQAQRTHPLGKIALKPSVASLAEVSKVRLCQPCKGNSPSSGKSNKSPAFGKKSSRIPRRMECMKMKFQFSPAASQLQQQRKVLENKLSEPVQYRSSSPTVSGSYSVSQSTSGKVFLDKPLSTEVPSSHIGSQMELNSSLSPPKLPKRRLLRRPKQSINHQIANCFMLMDWKGHSNSSIEKVVQMDIAVEVGPVMNSHSKLSNSL